jgi:uncharacterized membrane protein
VEKNKKLILILTSIGCLLPVCLSIAVYNDLPEQIVMQWNFEGNPNWYAHKAVGAFGLPLFLMAVNIVTNIFIFYKDPKRENISKTMQIFAVWFAPFLSLIIMPLFLFKNLDVNVPIKMIVMGLAGIILIFTGNYMPKSRQNNTVGIKILWTLKNSENWNKTHRLAGILWIVCGMFLLITAFLPLENIAGVIIILIILLIMITVPIIYSFILHKKEK